MWNLFTISAKKVVAFAQEEAFSRNDTRVSTEHLLLGLLRESEHEAIRVLQAMNADIDRIRQEAINETRTGKGGPPQNFLLTPRGKRAIELAYLEAQCLNIHWIGTEHLLLGLIRDKQGRASKVLRRNGVDLGRTRNAIVELTNEKQPGMAPPSFLRRLLSDVIHDWVRGRAGVMNRPPSSQEYDWLMFTERGRKAIIVHAQGEARRLGVSFVTTEHLLLGIVSERDMTAAQILNRIGVSADQIRTEIDKEVVHGFGPVSKKLRLTASCKHAVHAAYEELPVLHNSYIGTEHLLLGILLETEEPASRVLIRLGVTYDAVLADIRALQGGPDRPWHVPSEPPQATVWPPPPRIPRPPDAES